MLDFVREQQLRYTARPLDSYHCYSAYNWGDACLDTWCRWQNTTRFRPKCAARISLSRVVIYPTSRNWRRFSINFGSAEALGKSACCIRNLAKARRFTDPRSIILYLVMLKQFGGTKIFNYKRAWALGSGEVIYVCSLFILCYTRLSPSMIYHLKR